MNPILMKLKTATHLTYLTSTNTSHKMHHPSRITTSSFSSSPTAPSTDIVQVGPSRAPNRLDAKRSNDDLRNISEMQEHATSQ